MSNATAKAQSATTPWGDSKVKRPLAAAAATYYPGTMIALDASGNAVKCDNTAGVRFDGIMVDSFRITVDSGDSAGDKVVTVDRPFRFQMAIAAAVAGDEGKAVYAAYDNEVSYSQTNSIHVGWVDRVVDSTTVEVRPNWVGVNGVVGFDGATLTFSGSTGGNTVVMPDNLADALSVKEGSNAYLTFTTTDSGETITVKKLLTFADAINVALNTTTGTKFGTGATQKLAFFNATPVVQPANTVDYVTNLTSLGLRATGGTAGATFPGLVSQLYTVFSGIVSPTALTASADDVAIGAVGVYRVATDGNGGQNLTGMVKTTNGQLVLIMNVGTVDSITIKHSATSSSANQFICPNSGDVTLRKNGSVYAWYDATSTKWRVMGA